jgi:hypothetical protein
LRGQMIACSMRCILAGRWQQTDAVLQLLGPLQLALGLLRDEDRTTARNGVANLLNLLPHSAA